MIVALYITMQHCGLEGVPVTIKEVASELGCTPMTVYRRLQRAGVNVGDLRDAAGNLTSEGVAVIGNLFATTGATNTTEGATPAQQAPQPAAAEVEVLRVKLESTQAMLEAVTGERDRLRTQVDILTRMLEAEQRQRILLLDDGHHHRRGGLFGWLRKGRGASPEGE